MRLLNRLTIKGLLLKPKADDHDGHRYCAGHGSSVRGNIHGGQLPQRYDSAGEDKQRKLSLCVFNLPEEEAKALTGNREVESSFETAGVGYAVLEGSQNEGNPTSI